jgi:hypothetical protein
MTTLIRQSLSVYCFRLQPVNSTRFASVGCPSALMLPQ